MQSDWSFTLMARGSKEADLHIWTDAGFLVEAGVLPRRVLVLTWAGGD